MVAGLGLQTLHAQPGGERREEMVENLRIAYITKQLELTPDEAQKFWPVYNNYSRDVKKLIQNNKGKKNELELEEDMLDLRKKYKSEFLKAVSEDKFNRFLRADRGFKDMLRRELERRQNGGGPGRGNNPNRPNLNF